MPSERIVERRRIFQQYKEDVKERGKPFFPYAMWHDTIMSFVVIVVIIGLSVVWKYSTPGDHHTTEPGWLGKLYDDPGRSRHDQLRPAPGLVLLLPLLPAADLQVARLGAARNDRHPDDRARAAARDAVHRPAARASPLAPAGGDRRLDPRRHLDGRPHLQGRDREGGARLGAEGAGAEPGRSSRASRTTRRRSRARSSSRSRAASTATCISVTAAEPRRAGADRRRREEQGHRVPDRPPAVPGVQERGLADAVVLRASASRA